ncbi:hypothetical protein [Sphingomonas soli]|uniref:hypothetical protein n=1 Tax=Sphingomonas soli TaxID=266127 RepID=UPI0012EE6609|nr:hypothetical protein [Sphingomonas soli]
MVETADRDQAVPGADAVAAHVKQLIGIHLPEACVPGVVAGLEGLAAHLTVLRAAERER